MASPTDVLRQTENFAVSFLSLTQNTIQFSNPQRPVEAIELLMEVLENQVNSFKEAIENSHVPLSINIQP